MDTGNERLWPQECVHLQTRLTVYNHFYASTPDYLANGIGFTTVHFHRNLSKKEPQIIKISASDVHNCQSSDEVK